MSRRIALLVAALPTLLSAAPRPAPTYVPRFEAVAETKLLMEGLAQANYRGLEGLLKKEPADAEAWAFARGQALLIAETGNLLLLRPPRTPEGQDAWFRQATDLRDAAAALARAAGARDYARSRAGLADVANSCNRCHQTFRVATRVGPAGRDGARP
jgi:cytochrome c556